jgi:hypothetical protein
VARSTPTYRRGPNFYLFNAIASARNLLKNIEM